MLPSGFTQRTIALTDHGRPTDSDVDLALAVVQAADTAVVGASEETRASIRSLLASPESIPTANRLILDSSSTPAGLVVLERDETARRIFIDMYAVPHDASTLYPALVPLGVELAQRHTTGEGWEFESACFEQDATLHHSLAGVGFVVVRKFWRMQVRFAAPLTDPIAPQGVRVEVASSDAQRRTLHRMFNESFAEHFGTSPKPYEEWITWHDSREDSRPDLQWLVMLEDEPVGLVICDDSRLAEQLVYIRSLGVIPSARGRGIGRWLLQTAFVHARREGRVGAALAVDGSNETGATHLYESVGMQPIQVIDVLRRRA